MTEHNGPINRNNRNQRKRNLAKPLIKSEIEYSQETSYQSDGPETRDTATEAYVETDNVYITTEIYSLTDVPSSLEKTKNAQPTPGMIIPEYYDEKCVVLRAYRNKSINTEDSNEFSEPCLSLKCIFPPESLAKKSGCYRREVERYCEPSMGRCVRIKWSMCKDTCPNLITSHTSQTVGDCSMKPEERIDSVNLVKDAAISMTNQAKGKHKPGTPMNLMTIQEEPKTDDEEMMESEYVEIEDEESDKNKYRKVDAPKTEDVAVEARRIESETLSFNEEISITPLNRDKVSRKGISTCKFEMGTIITDQPDLWVDRARRRTVCRQFSASRESFCCSSRVSDDFVCCTRLVHPSTNHNTVQCEIMKEQPISCEYFERCIPCTRRVDSRSRSNEICSIDYCQSKSNPTYGTLQETLVRRPLYGGNNGQRCSIAREPLEHRNNAYNQNYVNLNKGYYNGLGGYCWCNNAYNARNANTLYCAPRSQVVYHTPINYYHFFNTWY